MSEKLMTPEQRQQINKLMETKQLQKLTPEQLHLLAARALRIGRKMYPGDDAAAKDFQAEYMKSLAIAELEDITDRAILPGDAVLKQ